MTDPGRREMSEAITTSLRELFTALLVVFVVLKIVGKIDWPWWLVLTPFWVPAVVAIVAIAYSLIHLRLEIRSLRRQR